MSRTRLARWSCLIVLLATLALGAWLWQRGRRPARPVPEIPLSADVDAPLAEAISSSRQAVLREPDNAAAWGRLGKLLLANGFTDQASPCLAEAERLQPDEPRWPYLQAIPLLLSDRDAAIPYLQRTVELCDRCDPDKATPRLTLAEVYLEKGQLDTAAELCQQILERQPDNARAHFNLGMIALLRNDLDAAATHFTRSAASPYARKKACAQLAAVSLRRGDPAAAETFSRQAEQARPDLPWDDPYVTDYQQLALGRQNELLLAERLEQEGRLAEETKLLRTIAEDYPDDRSYVALGIALAKMRNYPAAEEMLRRALKQAPDRINALYALGVVLYRQGEQLQQSGDEKSAADRFRAAAASEQRTLQLKPDHAMAHMFLGMALEQSGQTKEAIDAYRSAVRCRPELAQAHLHLGEALAADGQKAEALIHLRHAVEMSPADDARPRQALARLRGESEKKN